MERESIKVNIIVASTGSLFFSTRQREGYFFMVSYGVFGVFMVPLG